WQQTVTFVTGLDDQPILQAGVSLFLLLIAAFTLGRLARFLTLHAVKLTGASLFQTPLKGLDLTDCVLDGITVAGSELRGATVTLFQAADLARLLGLIVK
ncbi:MAG: hypothetical protein RRY21_07270, partial [Oscillospiraceae bacterium]